jgi:predicted amidohydrolase
VNPETPWREKLLQRLEGIGWPLPETLFVLLWSYFQESGVRRIENQVTSRDEHSLYVEPFLLPKEKKKQNMALMQGVASLRGLQGLDFDLEAIRWLATLDRVVLKNRKPESHLIPGLDGQRRFRVYRRNPFLAEALGLGPASEREQSRTIEAVLRYNKAVTVDWIQDYKIESKEDWGPSLRRRLQIACDMWHFRVLLCPLKTPLSYPGLPDPKRVPKGAAGGAAFVHLSQISNEAELLAEIPDVLATARDQEITLLVLPELSIPQGVETEIQRILRTHGPDGHPILTLFGRCHRKNEKNGLYLNEAVLLGPDGSEILCYLKQTRYTGRHVVVAWDEENHPAETSPAKKQVPVYLEEQIELGDKLLVLDFPFGNLAPLICLDLLHLGLNEILRQSHADLFVVPSLSETTGAHRASATRLMISNRASTFVTNRWIEDKPAEPSFYRIPSEEGVRQHQPQDGPYLLFCLEALLEARRRREEDEGGVDSQARVN